MIDEDFLGSGNIGPLLHSAWTAGTPAEMYEMTIPERPPAMLLLRKSCQDKHWETTLHVVRMRQLSFMVQVGGKIANGAPCRVTDQVPTVVSGSFRLETSSKCYSKSYELCS